MSIDVDTQPIGVGVSAGDDDLNHFVCCNPEVALCGADTTGLEWGDPDEVEPDDCAVCLDLRDSSCGAAFCRIRNWWRSSRFGRRDWQAPP